MATKTAKSGVGKAEKASRKLISIDVTDAMVLELDQKAETKLVWDPYSFRTLPDEVVKQLSEESRMEYYKAKIRAEDQAKEAEKLMKLDLEVMSPLEMNSGYRLRIRERTGWHQCWKAPGADFDLAMAGPYKQVRKQKEGEEMEPGQENGEVLKLLDGEGKVELIAVECRQELYEAHLESMAIKSSRMLSGAKEGFFRAAEEINRKQTNREARLIATDESNRLQE